MWYALAADLIVVIHILYVAYVVVGLGRSVCNPKGWEKVAGGRAKREPPETIDSGPAPCRGARPSVWGDPFRVKSKIPI